MKLLKFTLLSLFMAGLTSCSGDSNDPVNDDNDPETTSYAMTAKINGTPYNMVSPFGGNEASYGGFTLYPDETHLHLQGWPTNMQIGAMEITIYIDRSNLEPGTYPINTTSNPDATNVIDFINNTNDEFEDPISGSLTITEVNTTTKVIKGTFELQTSNDEYADNPPVNFTITDGTFNYKYDVD